MTRGRWIILGIQAWALFAAWVAVGVFLGYLAADADPLSRATHMLVGGWGATLIAGLCLTSQDGWRDTMG